jgi:hypothetical protein
LQNCARSKPQKHLRKNPSRRRRRARVTVRPCAPRRALARPDSSAHSGEQHVSVTGKVKFFNEAKGFTNYEGGFQKIYWDQIDDFRNGIVYEWRQGTTWDSAQFIRDYAHPPFIAQGNGMFLVKARCQPVAGLTVYSENAAEITIAGNQLSLNLLASFDEKATGWAGTFQNGIASVSFNQANGTDVATFSVTLPSGATGYTVQRLNLFDCTASITAMHFGLFDGAGATGNTLITNTTGTNTATGPAAANSVQAVAQTTSTSWYSSANLFLNQITQQGSTVTCNGTLWLNLLYLLKRDIDPSANDNSPAFMDRMAA